MHKLFEFVEHIGKWRTLIQSRDINNEAIESRHIAAKAVTLSKIAQDVITYIDERISNAIAEYKELVDGDLQQLHADDQAIVEQQHEDVRVINERMDFLQQLVESYHEHGIAVANEFGNNPRISISQATMTDAINKLWDKISDITGEIIRGIDMTVTPDYFIGDDGADIHVVARTVDLNDHFEHIAFYVNGVLIDEAEDVDFFECDTHLEGTSLIKCVAKILGVEYSREQVITHYESFWLGAADVWMPVINTSNLVPITQGMRGTHAVTCEDNDYIFIIMGEYLRSGFYGATMSNVEIPFVESSVAINHERYCVFRSVNRYEAGTYNIEING